MTVPRMFCAGTGFKYSVGGYNWEEAVFPAKPLPDGFLTFEEADKQFGCDSVKIFGRLEALWNSIKDISFSFVAGNPSDENDDL
jgi:hypothetical protein